MARLRVGARRGVGRAGGRRDRPLRPDARPGRARRVRRGHPSRDPVERPADGGGVRRDRGTGRARAADRADGEPRADGLHRPEAPLAPPSRAGGVRTDRPDHAAEGLRAPPADGRVGDRRLRRVGHPPARRRAARLEHGRARRPRPSRRVAPARARVPRARGDRGSEYHVVAGDARRGRRRRPARGRGRGRSRPGRECCPSCSARRASSSHRSPPTPTTPRRASTPSATPCPGRGRRWA